MKSHKISGARESKAYDLDRMRRIAVYLFYIMMDKRILHALYRNNGFVCSSYCEYVLKFLRENSVLKREHKLT